MSVVSAATFVDTLCRGRLLSGAQQAELVQLQPRFPEARALAAQLLERGWLTSYQVNQLLVGKGADLVLGPYVLLQRLGEGGVGQVFKARHAEQGRTVALKMIRKDLLADPDVVQRFRREIKLISQLNHGNIVQASDGAADGLPGVLIMEYVEGTDLQRLVEKQGPLPPAQAADYIRQAALALQHIHERGLVHRDIKPPNLILTPADKLPWGQIKVLDLGLARLSAPTDSKTLGMVTQTGTIMGTLDYLAPEQALDFRNVDIRADIYSLGCTFFYLLAGRAPFHEGTAAHKLLLHQMKPPPAIEQLRPDLPKHLPPVLQRMLAKSPAERWQTPGEVARLLANPQTAPITVASANAKTEALPVALVAHDATPRRRRPVLWLGLGGAVLAALLLIVVLWRATRPAVPLGAGPTATTPAVVSTGPRLPSQTVYLWDLPAREPVTAPTMPLHKARFYWFGSPYELAVGGKKAPKGLMVHPPSQGQGKVKYQLDQPYETFKAGVGLVDGVEGSPTPLTFRVLGDGRQLWESKPVLKPGELQEATVPITGVKVLELVIDCPGPEHRGEKLAAHALWLDPQVSR